MKKIKHTTYLAMAMVMLLMLSVPSCIFDNFPPEEDEKQAFILLSLDGDKVTTRGGDLFVDDALINKIRIIVFDNGTVEKNQLFESGNSDFENPFRVQVEPGTKKVYVIANETSNLGTALTDANLSEVNLKDIMADEISAPLASPLVMTGEIPAITLVPGLQQSPVTLKRVAAKINLSFKKATDANVEITKVSLINNTKKSTLWESSTVAFTQDYWTHSANTAMTLSNSLQNYLTLYVYENLGNSSADKTNATQLEVEATFDGTFTIYRVYVNEEVPSPGSSSGSDPNSSTVGTPPIAHYYNIKRNHEYRLTGTITRIGEYSSLYIDAKIRPWTTHEYQVPLQ